MMEVPYLFNIFVELPAERDPIVKFISDSFKVSKRLRVVLKSASRDPKISNKNIEVGVRIPTVKLKIPEKNRIQKFCYIQVIVFDLSYLLVAAVGT